jgi:hypothetical protein
VVAWVAIDPGTLTRSISARRFAPDGSSLGAFQVNTTTFEFSTRPAVAAGANGDFIVAWGRTLPGLDWNLFARSFDNSGSPRGPEFQVSPFTAASLQFLSAAMDDDGEFVIVWNDPVGQYGLFSVFGRRFAHNGEPQGEDFQVTSYTGGAHQMLPSTAMDADGDFVVAWTSLGQPDGYQNHVWARRFSSAGLAHGPNSR